ncbi:MAG TPA: hypothetical protein VFN25_13005 [Dokdonella sp.]|uniref:hypothetical protein n=1 Tax=Dokdonella sp. TaxID=2291710 RepID=UPI002D7ED5DB|nr:hypothetical protein [Dokdonella sp.]HET9033806.1 hypothetical protein [Dokdonella sp.]
MDHFAQLRKHTAEGAQQEKVAVVGSAKPFPDGELIDFRVEKEFHLIPVNGGGPCQSRMPFPACCRTIGAGGTFDGSGSTEGVKKNEQT